MDLRRSLLAGGLALALLPTAIMAQTTNFWTGGGSTNLWSDAGNWSAGELPATTDIVYLGHPDYTPNAAQDIVLDVAGVSIRSLYVGGTENRTVTLSAADAEVLTILNTDMFRVISNATANVIIDVGLHTPATGRTLRHDSPTALVTFDQRLTSGGVGTDTFTGVGTYLFNARWADASYNISGSPTIILNVAGTIARAWQPVSGSSATLLLGQSVTFSRRWSNSGHFDVATYEDSAERALYFGYGITAGGTMTLTNSPYGGTGPIEVRVGRISSFIMNRGTGRIVTRPGDTVSIWRDVAAGTFHTLGWSSIGSRITGGGNFWVRGGGTGTNLLESALDYTGRTMISNGRLALRAFTTGGTTYYGSLPSGTILEIGSAGHFNLNGIDQTLGGITDWRGFEGTLTPSSGHIHLSGATLTINAVTNSSFGGGGNIHGPGTLAKTGPATFTLDGSYANAAGRTLRVEEGLLEVTGDLSFDGDSTLEAVLSPSMAGALIEVGGLATLGDATFALTLADGFTGTIEDTYTIIDGTTSGQFAGLEHGDRLAAEGGYTFAVAYDSFTLTLDGRTESRYWDGETGVLGQDANWRDETSPGTDEAAVFNHEGIYTVTLSGDVTHAGLALHPRADLYDSDASDGDNRVTLDLAGHAYTISGRTDVATGSDHDAEMVVTGGDLVTQGSVHIGLREGSAGVFTLTGTGTTWTAQDTVALGGEDGDGSLTVADGAAAMLEEALTLNPDGSGQAAVLVTGTGSEMLVETLAGENAELLVTDGGLLQVAQDLSLASPAGHEAAVTVSAARLEAGRALLGDDGGTVDLILADGGEVAVHALLGVGAGSALTLEEGRIEAGELEMAGGALLAVTLFGEQAHGAALIEVTGEAAFDGVRLEAAPDSGYTPEIGDVFTLLQAGDIGQDLLLGWDAIEEEWMPLEDGAVVWGDPEGEDPYMVIGYNRPGNDSVTLSVIPEPGALSLLALVAGFGLFLSRRRMGFFR